MYDERAATRYKRGNILYALSGISMAGVAGAAIYGIWSGDWRPLATAVVLWLFFALVAAAERDRTEARREQR